MKDRLAFGVAIADKMDHHPKFAAASRLQKERAGQFLHDRLHAWAASNLRVGASANDTERQLKTATEQIHQDVRAEANKLGDNEFQVTYGFPVMLLITLIPTLWNWWKMICEWLGW